MHDVDRYLAGSERLRYIGFVHGANDATIEHARGLDRKLTEVGIEHEFLEHDGGHELRFEEEMRMLLPQLRRVPPEVPAVVAVTLDSLIILADQSNPLDGLRLTLEASLKTLDQPARLVLDASRLGDDTAVALDHVGNAEYAASGTVSPERSGRFSLPVMLEIDGLDSYVAHALPVVVFPSLDVPLYGDDELISDWETGASFSVAWTPRRPIRYSRARPV